MATAILRSHDCLRDRFGPRCANSWNPNPNPKVNHASRSRRRKRSLSDGSRRSRDSPPSSPPPAKGLVMGQVKILKRGEEIKPKMFVKDLDLDLDLDLSSTDRIGPDPDVVKKEIRVPDLYAGPTALVSSPHPRDLPFPSSALIPVRSIDRDLRKMLKI